jgi:transcriptional regulator with XRE-family HTH domain
MSNTFNTMLQVAIRHVAVSVVVMKTKGPTPGKRKQMIIPVETRRKIHRIMRKNEISERKLAKLVGVHHGQINSLLSNLSKKKPRPTKLLNLQSIADALNVSINELRSFTPADFVSEGDVGLIERTIKYHFSLVDIGLLLNIIYGELKNVELRKQEDKKIHPSEYVLRSTRLQHMRDFLLRPFGGEKQFLVAQNEQEQAAERASNNLHDAFNPGRRSRLFSR